MKDRDTSSLIFLSYAEEDKAYCAGFIKHMSEPIRQKVFTLWHPYNIEAGLNKEDEITAHLQQASLVLLLLSSDYLANDACHQQMQQAIEIGQQEPERVRIILLRSCNWRDITGIEQFHFLPRNRKPLSHWSTPYQDDIIQDITTEIVQLVTGIQQPIDLLIPNTTQSDRITPLPTPLPQAPPALPIPAKTTSRRAVLIGAVAVAVVGASAFAILQQHPQGQAVTPSGPTALSKEQLFIYRGHSDNVHGVAWSPDGQWIASCSRDKTVQVWNANDGNHVLTYRGHSDLVNRVAWSLDGQRIASASNDKTVQIWNANDGGNVFTYRGHFNYVDGIAWSPDGKRIASASFDQTVQVWNANDGGNVFTYRGHTDAISSVAWSPDGQWIASGSADKTVQVWNANDGSKAFTYRGHSDWVQSVEWSPDGKRIASAAFDKTVQVWNTSNRDNVFIYKGHADAALSVAWSPDGNWIVSSFNDGIVQVWKAGDGSHISTYTGHTQTVWLVAWSPDGKRITSCSDDATVQIWHVV